MSPGYLNFLEGDLETILASEVFDQPMEYLPEDGEAFLFRGLFSGPSEENPVGGSSAPMVSQTYSVAYKETDLPRKLKRGDRIQARGRVWEVYKQPHVDGQGLATAWLHLVNP